HVEPHAEALRLRPLAQELDVLRREIEPAHPVAALREADEVGPGAAGDVQHGADGPPGIGPEGVDEEVHLLFPVHVERDLVVAGRRVLAPLSPGGVAHRPRSSPPSSMNEGRAKQARWRAALERLNLRWAFFTRFSLKCATGPTLSEQNEKLQKPLG